MFPVRRGEHCGIRSDFLYRKNDSRQDFTEQKRAVNFQINFKFGIFLKENMHFCDTILKLSNFQKCLNFHFEWKMRFLMLDDYIRMEYPCYSIQ